MLLSYSYLFTLSGQQKKNIPKARNYFLKSLITQGSKKPIFSSPLREKTPEYSGVFFVIFDTNIGF